MEEKSELKKYIAHWSIRGDAPYCNDEQTKIIVSPVKPTEEFLRERGLINTVNYCAYTGLPQCNDCSGTRLDDFWVEEFSYQKALELNLVQE